jgi:uncharacterized protein (DUF1501 family)
MYINRRNFLRTVAGTAFLLGYPQLSVLASNFEQRRLLVVLLRGGMDGIAAVPPHGDPSLSSARHSILINDTRKLDNFFSIHPSLKFLSQEYSAGRSCFVHAASFPYVGRSHFQGQNVMEAGTESPDMSPTGWIGRAMAAAKYRSMAFSLPIPLILRGNNNTFNHYPAKFSVTPDAVYDAIFDYWNKDQALSDVAAKLKQDKMMGGNFRNPEALMTFASDQMAKDDGPRVGLLDLVGFDTHALQGDEHGKQSEMLSQTDNLIEQFSKQMGDKWKNTVVVTVTEFGRSVNENGSKGTDHGWGSCIFLAGGLVKKAQVVSDWPGLKSSQLYEGRDLKVTIDARDVYGEVVSKVFGLDPDQVKSDVFFGYKPKRDWDTLRS